MSLALFWAVLGAAFLHASWNAAIKIGGDKQSAMLVLSVGHAGVGALVAATRPLPGAEALPWLAASGLIHMAYQLLLSYAYDHGDLSRVYPIARGTAPLIVALVGAVLLADEISAMEYAGVTVLGIGILAMARGVVSSGESRRMLPFAFGAALATAGYSLVDGAGARASGDALAYVGWLMIASALFYIPAALALRGRAVLAASPRGWALGLAAAVASFAAYAIVVWAMTRAPIALVTALRETSILFAMLIGWAVFGDGMNRGKLLAGGLIVAGVVLTRL
jgi:drug/metabolite transporter (DMT)-like permease